MISGSPLLEDYIAERGRHLFHLTDAANLPDILRRGLRPSGADSEYERSLVRADHVYLCDAALARQTLAGHLADWGDAALAIDLTGLDPALLHGDEDYWRGELMDEGATDTGRANVLRLRPDLDTPETVFASLRDGGACCYGGVISPVYLRIAELPVRPDLPQLAGLGVDRSAAAALRLGLK